MATITASTATGSPARCSIPYCLYWPGPAAFAFDVTRSRPLVWKI